MHLNFFDVYAKNYRAYKDGAWCYEDGLLYRGLECLHQATDENRWFDHLLRLIEPQLQDGPALRGYDMHAYNIDNINPGRALLYCHEITGEPRFMTYAQLLIDQLETHPRTHSGNYWHKLRYPWQIWLDGLYMGIPFQIDYGIRTGNAALVRDALNQLKSALDISYVPETGLYAHATDEAKKQNWANQDTGHTSAHWARALGWLAMALVDVATLVGMEQFASLKSQSIAFFKQIESLRQPDGLWLQVIDQPELEGNFEESSATAMFVYSLIRARALGLYDGNPTGLLDSLFAKFLKADAHGNMRMVDLCHVAGLGMYQGRYRDGTAEYYISETLLDNDIKGVGPLMMAVAADMKTAEQPLDVFAET